MAVCEDCGQEMMTAPGCSADALIIHDERFARNRIGRPIGPSDRCGDCGAQKGGYHHYGCDLERCPRCARQLISCGCSDVAEDEDAVAIIVLANDVVVYPEGLQGLHVPPTRFPFAVARPM